MKTRINNKIPKNFLLFMVISIVMIVFLKFFQEKIFPLKYFLDGYHILGIMSGQLSPDHSYTFTANVFSFINVLGLKDLVQWRIAISLIFMPITLLLISKNINYTKFDYLFLLACIGLLGIYVFNLSKDIIQYIFFILIAGVLSNNNLNNLKKIFLISLILLVESIRFRVYYALLAVLIVSLYVLYTKIIFKSDLSKKNIFSILLFAIFLFFGEVFILSKLSISNYDAIMNARYSVNIWRGQDINAVTIVNDLLGYNTNIFVFIGNYLINFIRFLMPVELLIKGPKYILFVAYQFVLLYYLLKSRKNVDQNNILIFITIVSYIMVSVIFEPDFGSLVRHESALFPIVLLLIQQVKNKKVDDGNA